MSAVVDNGPVFNRTFELGDGLATGFLVIDSDLGGGGTGGVRMGPSVTELEVVELASEMSNKFAWLNIARGGAKSGISIDNSLGDAQKRAVLSEFGKNIQQEIQSGRYVPGMDLGVGPTELDVILKAAGINSNSAAYEGDIDASYYTALTVFIAIDVTLRYFNRDLAKSTFLIEGLGKVGRHLVKLVDQAGARITGVSTIKGALIRAEGIDVGRILELIDTFGDDCVRHYDNHPCRDPLELYSAPADILVPGARVHGINRDNVESINAHIVVPMANAPATKHAEDVLHQKGILYLPGFVANSGGIFCWFLSALDEESRRAILRAEFGQMVAELIQAAEREGVSVSQVARYQASMKAQRMRAESQGSIIHRLSGFLRKLGPRRIPYILLRKIFGQKCGRGNSIFARWYFRARYFR